MVEQKGSFGGGVAAQIAHQLNARLGDVGGVAEVTGIDDTVIGFIRLGKFREVAVCPIKFAAVDNGTAQLGGMAIHIFGGGVDHNICSEVEWTAKDRGGKGVVHNQRQVVGVCHAGHLFDVQHRNGRIGDGLGKDHLGLWVHLGLEGLLVVVGIYKVGHNAEALEGYGEQIDGASIDGGGAQNVVALVQQIEHRNQGSSLSRGGAQCADTAFEGGNFLLHGSNCWVGDAGVHVAVGSQVKELGHLSGRFIFIGCALIDRQLQRLAVLGSITLVQALGFHFHVIKSFVHILQNVAEKMSIAAKSFLVLF